MKALLVSPAFHGYWRAIATALEVGGHEVAVCTYDSHGHLGGRIWHQVRHEVPARTRIGARRGLAKAHTARAVSAVRKVLPEVVVVVKGDTLGDDFWELLDDLALPRVTWLYDEVRRTRWSFEGLRQAGPIATYSRLDDDSFRAAGIDTRYLPLAFDHRLVDLDARTRNDEVIFVGARYSSRERIVEMLAAADVPVRAFGRDWSSHPVDRLRTLQWHRPSVPAGRDLDRDDAYREMAAGLATLNMHGDQDGFTMRTFEACGVGGLQLIDRSDLDGLYEPGEELLAFSGVEELVDLCGRADVDTQWADRIREAGLRRTLAEHTFDHRASLLASTWDRPSR